MRITDQTWSQGDGVDYEDISNQVGNFAWVLDGATALVKKEGSVYTPRWLVEQADKILAAGAKRSTSIQEISEYYRQNFNPGNEYQFLMPEEKRSFAMALLNVNHFHLEYMCFADCSIILKQQDNITLLQDEKWAARNKGGPPKEFFAQPKEQQIQSDIIGRRKMNTPEGYWIGTADGEGFRHAAINKRTITDPDTEIIICSDGFERAISFGLYEWSDIFQHKLDEITNQLRKVENHDIDLKQYPRGKKSDDIAAIRLVL